jgi:hypothetical protein
MQSNRNEGHYCTTTDRHFGISTHGNSILEHESLLPLLYLRLGQVILSVTNVSS